MAKNFPHYKVLSPFTEMQLIKAKQMWRFLRLHWVLFFLCVLFLVLTGWLIVDAESFQNCISHKCIGLFITENQDAITALGTVVIALFTIILGVSTVMLWRATKRLVESSENTAERQLRAYVCVVGKGIIAAPPLAADISYNRFAHPISAGHKAEFHMCLENYGQTPAMSVNVTSSLKLVNWPIDPNDLTEDEDEIFSKTEGICSQDNLGMRDSRTFGKMLRKPLTETDMDDLRGKKKAIVMYGYVTYKDVFKRERKTCFRWHVGGSWGVRGIQTTAHNEGNDMD